MAAPSFSEPQRRDSGNDPGYNGYGGDYEPQSWWWTPAGLAVRYAIVALIFLLVLGYFVGGYLHAQRRLRKGKQPLRYHAWMIRSPVYGYERRQPLPRPVYAYYPDPNNSGYQMEGYPPPPPAYHNSEAPPPVYQPPPGASKAMADQNYRETVRPAAGESSASGSGGQA